MFCGIYIPICWYFLFTVRIVKIIYVSLQQIERRIIVKRINLGFVKYFFQVLFVLYWISGTFFVHQHTIDGVRVVHSHPYTDSNHGHSQSDLMWIAFMGHPDMEDLPLSAFIPSVVFTFAVIVFPVCTSPLFRGESSLISLRAPPVLQA